MNEQSPFSLAVVRGPNAGRVLRTDRKRISVGSSLENDLVLTDSGIEGQHFTVLIENGTWRVHTFSPDEHVAIDRRWRHPRSGLQGAILRAATVELILFPGELEDAIVREEIAKRSEPEITDRMPKPPADFLEEPRSPVAYDATSDADRATLLDVSREALFEGVTTTKPLAPRMNPIEDATTNRDDLDVLRISQMPTVAGDHPPEDLRRAARIRLLGERMTPPSSLMQAGDDVSDTVAPSRLSAESAPFGDVTVAVPALSGTSSTRRSIPDATPLRDPSERGRSTSELGIARRVDPGESHEDPAESSNARLAVPMSSRSSVWDRARLPTGQRRIGSDDESILRDRPRLPAPRRDPWEDSAERKSPQAGRSYEGSQDVAPPEVPSARHLPQRPSVAEPKAKRTAARGRHASARDLSKASEDPAFEIVRHPDGPFATATRLFGAKIEDFARTLGYRTYMVTSAEPLSGKTTAVFNLAFALAEDTTRRVALVEANFRHPRFGAIMHAPEHTGIIPVLEGRAQLAESVIKISDRNLIVLPCGGRHTNPTEILASPRFKALIAELANTVDIALIDAPSVKPFADANLLLPLVDAVCMVVAGGSTRSGWLSQATAQIGENRILGLLVNRLPTRMAKELVAERKRRLRHA